MDDPPVSRYCYCPVIHYDTAGIISGIYKILMPTVIPLIPGGSLYYAMDAALRHDMPQFFLKAQAAVGLAVALAAGIMAVTSMQHLISALFKMIKPAQ